MSKSTLVRSASILAAAGIIAKMMGAVFRLPLVNVIGDTGMANYSPAYYIYSFLVILATSGIPVAISKLVSESTAIGNHYQAHKVFRISSMLMLGMGVVSFFILFTFAPQIAGLMANEDAALGMRAIAPSLILVPIMAAYRGYFQGLQNMKPTAFSQIVEQFFRVAVGLGAAFFLFYKVGDSLEKYDKYTLSAAGANFGATAGSLGGLLMILFIYLLAKKGIDRKIRRTKKMGSASTKRILTNILIIAVPITIGAAINPILNLIDSALVMNRLVDGAGYTEEIAKELYGQLSGFVGSLINFPQLIAQSVAVSMVPVIAAAHKLKQKSEMHKNILLGLRMASIIGYPCAFGLMVLSEPILLMLYPAQKESAANAASILTIMAMGIIFLVTTQTIIGILQGIGKPMVPVYNMLVGMVVKIAVTWVFVGIPSVNVNGAALGTLVAYIVTMMLNVKSLKKHTRVKLNVRQAFVRPFISALLMGIIVLVVYKGLFMLIPKNSIVTLISVMTGVITYAVLIFVTKTIRKDEVVYFPKGDKLLKVLNKFMK